jgi:acyl-CoA reductase-like NAD-dependent aldehyde dehydrogenase
MNAVTQVSRAAVIEVRFPFTNEVVGTVPKASVDDARKASPLPTPTSFKSRYDRATIMQKAASCCVGAWPRPRT